MSTLFTSGLNTSILVDKQAEREYLLNQLQLTLNLKAQLGNQEKAIRARLAIVERETVERERSILVDSQAEYKV